MRAVHSAIVSVQDFRIREGNTHGARIDSDVRCRREQDFQQTFPQKIRAVEVMIFYAIAPNQPHTTSENSAFREDVCTRLASRSR
jgi:hypothetical protein